MTSRELCERTLNHEEVERLPRDLMTVPYMELYRKDELQQFFKEFPMDIEGLQEIHYGKSPYAKGEPCRVGKWIDEFGSEWEALEDGVAGEVKNPPIKTEADLEKYRLPWEILENFSGSNQFAAYKNTNKFVKCGSHVRPFERMQFLRGTEQLFMDIATEDPIFIKLLERLHEFNIRELKLLAAQAVDAIQFMDDWGSQRSLLINPIIWRKFFKPMYKEYCDIIRSGGKYVFFHTDGFVEAIYPDLIEVGMHAVNTQLFCMDIEKIGKQYGGRIVFWGEIDRQRILPFGTEHDARAAVRRLGNALLHGKRTGMIAELSWETLTPYKNVIAAYDEFNKL